MDPMIDQVVAAIGHAETPASVITNSTAASLNDVAFNIEKELLDHGQPITFDQEIEDETQPYDSSKIEIETKRSKRTRKAPAFLREEQAQESLGLVEPCIGMRIKKKFEDDCYYTGKVVHDAEEVLDQQTGRLVLIWKVQYQDGDEEELTQGELSKWIHPDDSASAPRKKKIRKAFKSNDPNILHSYEEAKKTLCYLPGLHEDEISKALDQMKGPPYGLQTAVHIVHQNRTNQSWPTPSVKFKPEIGLRIRKLFDGFTYYGTVTKDAETVLVPPVVEGDAVISKRMWEVTFDDGEKDDMDWKELLQCRASRPMRTNPIRGRSLGCVELFSGCGVVTQHFAERRWRVRSVDTLQTSPATDKRSIMNIDYKTHFGYVPDFIWASPPCFTYSNLSGGKHRMPEKGEFEKTSEALEHNHYFAKMSQMMHWAKSHHPHLIVVIENPVGSMSKMPLMKASRTLDCTRR